MTNSYYILRPNNDPEIPALNEGDDCPDYFFEDCRIQDPEKMSFTIGDPRPKMPNPGDFMFSPDPLVSNKVYKLLSPIPDRTFQLIPAEIYFDGKMLIDFWGLHVFRSIKCLDMNKSDITFLNESILEIRKLEIDNNLLNEIPIEERLIFRLGEKDSYIIFHESVVRLFTFPEISGANFVHFAEANTKSLF